jgi:hypothetical protein
MLNNILFADKNNKIIKYYHTSNKLLIPFLIPSFVLSYNSTEKKYFDLINIINLSFHSYVSFSSVITDYDKKILFINEKYIRFTNLKLHSILSLYSLYYLYQEILKKNQENLKKNINKINIINNINKTIDINKN